MSQLHELHHQLRRLRLLRRTGHRLVASIRDREVFADPSRLLLTIANDLLTGDDFRAACAELAVPLLLSGFEADWAEPLARRVRPAIVAEGWQSNGEPPGARDVS